MKNVTSYALVLGSIRKQGAIKIKNGPKIIKTKNHCICK